MEAKIKKPETIQKLLTVYTPVPQRFWANFFGVSVSTFNGWAKGTQSASVPHLMIVEVLCAVPEQNKLTVLQHIMDAIITAKDVESILSARALLSKNKSTMTFLGLSSDPSLDWKLYPE